MGKVGTLNTGNNRAIFGQIGRVSQCAELELLQQLFKVTFLKKMNSYLIITGSMPHPSSCPGRSRGITRDGAYAPSSEDSSLMSDFPENKKGSQGQAVVPPQRPTRFKDFIYNLCVPGGGEGLLAASWRRGPGSPTLSRLFSHFISSDTLHYRQPLPLWLPPPPSLQSGWLAGPSQCPWDSQVPGPIRPQL